MPISYEVGAIFAIEDRSTPFLERMAGLFETLAEKAAALSDQLARLGEGAFSALTDGATAADAALQRTIEQANAMAASWDNAAAAAGRYGEAAAAAAAAAATGAAGRPSSGTGGSPPSGGGTSSRPSQLPTIFGTRDDRLNAAAENRNYDYMRSGQRADAEAFNEDLDYRMSGQRLNADAENRNYDAARDRQRAEADYINRDRDYANTGNRRNAEAENADFDRRQQRERAQADYENRDFDLRERERARQARPDASFEENAEAAGAGFLGGRGLKQAGGVLRGMGPLIAGISGFEAEKAAMTEDLAIRQALMGLNITDKSPEFAEGYKRLHELAYTSSKGTIFSESQSAVPMREALPVLAKQGLEGVEAAESTYPIALRIGELSQLRHKGTLGSEAVAAEEFAHLEQRFEPNQLEKSLDLINAIAMRTDTSVRAQLNIMKYGLPTALSAGIDPDVAAAEMGVAQLRLGSTTTAGTGYSRFLLGALHSGGGVNAQLSPHLHDEARKAQKEFEGALRLHPDATASADSRHARSSEHDAALTALGITSKSGKLMDETATGELDVNKIKEQIFQYGQTHTRQQSLETIQNAFGTYGGRYASAYLETGYIEREKQQVAAYRAAPSVKEEQESLSNSTMQRFEQMIANIANIGNTLASTTLSGLNVTFQTLNERLVGLNEWLREHQTAATVAGYTGLGAATLGTVGLLGAGIGALWRGAGGAALWRGVTGLFGGGGAAAAGGAAAGAPELALAAGASPTLGLASLGGIAYGAKGALEGGSDWLTDLISGKGTAERRRNELAEANPFLPLLRSMFGTKTTPNDPEHHAGPSPGATATPPAAPQINLTIHNTMSGVADESTFQSLLHKFTDAIKAALEHSSSDAAGMAQSPYVIGGIP